jgi:hypothetical protein
MDAGQFNLGELSESPRDHIPDSWSHRGNCPVCGALDTLDIQHLSDAPDQFLCQACAAAFEILSKGSNIRIMVLPEALKPAWMDVINRWMSPEEVQRLYQRFSGARQIVSEDLSEIIPEPELSNREVMLSALELHHFGNSFEQIKLLLFQSGATQKQAAGALKRLEQHKQGENKRRGWMIISMGLISILCIGVTVGALWFTSRPTSSAGDSTTDSTVDSLLPAFDPAKVVTDLVGIPTPQVVKSGPGISHCPRNAAQAAELFGGRASSWSLETAFRAWTMVNTGDPLKIRVPQNMVAGYMKLDSMEMITVQGPATIQNINFIVITCE